MTTYPVHFPAMSGIAMPIAPAPAIPKTRPVAAGAVGLAALLVPVASFLPLYTVSGTPVDDESFVVSLTSWGIDHPEADDVSVPITGPLLVVATVLLLAAAVLCAVTATRSATPGLRRVAGMVTVTGATFLTSGVWAIVAQVVGLAAAIEEPRVDDEAKGFAEGPGAGLWLLVAGVVVALVAMALTLRATWRDSQSPDRSPATSSPTMWRAS